MGRERIESRRIKSAGGGLKLFPNNPLPSSKSPWHKKQCLVYKVPPFFMTLGSPLKGFVRFLRVIVSSFKRKLVGISSEDGGVNPHTDKGVARMHKKNRGTTRNLREVPDFVLAFKLAPHFFSFCGSRNNRVFFDSS